MVTLLKSLTDGGLLNPGTPERVANRPARTIYRPTDAGIALFRSRVHEGLTETAPASADFLTAVAYLGILPAADAIAVLRARAERLRRETPVIPAGLPEIQMIEVHYWLRVLATEISATNAAVVIAIDAASFAILAATYRFATPIRGTPPRTDNTGSGTAGFRFIGHDRTLLGLLTLSFGFFFLFGPFYVAMPIHIADDLHASALYHRPS